MRKNSDIENAAHIFLLCPRINTPNAPNDASLHHKATRVNDKALIAACLQEDRKAQQALFDHYAPAMLGVCKRYVKAPQDAEDVLIEAFFKVFTNLYQFKGEGSFEGWIRRIVVNESLMFLRRNHHLLNHVEVETAAGLRITPSIHEELAAGEILHLLDQLPMGYRAVFNLYVLEGYKHREIAELMGISINTSKSQLILAKKRLREMLGVGEGERE